MANKKRTDNRGRNLHPGESQRGNGTYMYRWTTDSKTHCIYAPDLGTLRRKEKAVKKDADDGLNYDAGQMTLNQLFDEFVELKRHVWKPATLKNNTSMYDNTLRSEAIAEMKISAIKPKDVQRLYTAAAVKGYRLSTLKFMSYLLGSTLSYAALNDYVRRDVSKGVLSSMKKLNTTPKIEKVPMTLNQLNSLIAFCENHPVYKKNLPFLIVAVDTGCRVGELAALQWSDVDLENAEISISKSLAYKSTIDEPIHYYMSGTKTAAGERTVDIDVSVDAFKHLYKTQKSNNIVCTSPVDGYQHFVFLNRSGKPLTPAQVNSFLKNVRQAYNVHEASAAKIDGRDPDFLPHISAHLLRHLNATLLIESGTSIEAVQGELGHTQSTTTSGYVHGNTDRDWVKKERKSLGIIVNF